MENPKAPSDEELLEHIICAYRMGLCEAALIPVIEAASELWARSGRFCRIQDHYSAADRPHDPRNAKARDILKKFNLL